MKVRLFSALALAVSLAILTVFPAAAQVGELPTCTRTWVGGGVTDPTSWRDGTNWAPVGMPVATDNVCIINDGAYTVVLSKATTVANLTIGLPGNVAQPTLLFKGDWAWGTAPLTVTGNLNNAGTLTLEMASGFTDDSVSVTNGTLTNTGVINVNQGAGGQRYIMANLVNQGTVNVNYDLAFYKPGGVFTNLGQFNIAADKKVTISQYSQTFKQEAGTLTNNGTFYLFDNVFEHNGGTTVGNALHLHVATLELNAPTPASFTLTGNSKLVGNVGAEQTVGVLSDPTWGHGLLTSATGFINAGTMWMQSDSHTSKLIVTNGILTNTGTITVHDSTYGFRFFDTHLVNEGTINVNGNLVLGKTDGLYTNRGQITIAEGKKLETDLARQTLRQDAGTLTVNGTLYLSSDTLEYNGGSITGNPPHLHTAKLNLATSSAGEFLLTGNSTLVGNVASGQTLGLLSNPTWGYGTLTSAAGFTNAGTIWMQSDSHSSTLAVTSGILTNTGYINVIDGVGGYRAVNASLVNQGTVNVNNDLRLSKASGVHSNLGQLNIAVGKNLTMYGDYQTFKQNGGTLTNNGTFYVWNNTFEFNGGTTAGTALQIHSSTLRLAATGSASFVTMGRATLVGSVAPAQTLGVLSNPTYGTTTLTSAAGFTNAGTIWMQSDSHASWLAVTNGVLTNAGTIEVLASTPGAAGGQQYFNASLVNQGSVNLNHNLTLYRSGGSYTNRGSMDIAVGKTLSINQGSFLQETPGTITGGGALVVVSGATLRGVGTIQADVQNDGRVGPGTSPGILNIVGNYRQGYNAYVDVEIGGPEPGSGYDRLNVSGTATLWGPLNISVINGYQPGPCDAFKLVTWGARSGTFRAVLGLGGATAGYYLRPDYNPNDFTTLAYDPATKVNLRPVSLNVAEGGNTATYLMCLKDQPTADVTVTASPDAQVTVSPAVLAFSLTDALNAWNSTRLLTVAAVDDLVTEPTPHTGIISHTASSGDAGYNGVALPKVTANIADNDAPPVASDGSAATAEDTSVAVSLAASDPDSASLSFSIVTAPTHGSLGPVSGNSVSYTPSANYHGSDSFTFTASDGANNSNVATITITVTPVNDAPVANAQAVETAEETPKAITLSGTDPEADALTYTVVNGPANGTLSGAAPNLTYTPKPNFNGSDSFTFKVNDGSTDSNVATVSITVTPVNDPPTANAGPDQTVDEGTAVSLAGTGSDPDGNTLTYAWTQTAGPSVTLSNAGSATTSFTAPSVDADAVLTFLLTVSDGTATATDAVNVTVRNTAPTTFQAARTIGYWKNHEDHLQRMLSKGALGLGDSTVASVAQAVQVLANSGAKDARDSLRAQLLATALNLRNGAKPTAAGADIQPVVDNARAFLASQSKPVEGKDPARAEAVALKDRLDAFNNSGE